jgi:hypothetical protein
MIGEHLNRGMCKHLTLAFVAFSALLTSGLASAQSTADASPATVDPTQENKPVQSEQDKRVLGVLPNYRTADGTKPFVPMTAGGKMHIAFKDSFDYPGFVLAAGFSSIYQLEDQNPSFGQGLKGYARRYGTAVGDQIIGNMMAEGIMPGLLREDPRYFRKVNGSIRSRLGYSITRVLIARNDKGNSCVNFAEISGNGIAAAIGAAYYPDGRTYHDTFQRMGTSIATDAISNVLKEFWPDIKRKYFQKRTSAGGIAP